MPVTHNFVSTVADDPAEQARGKVLPSHWNDGHAVSVDLATEVTGQVTLANLPDIADQRVLGNVSGNPAPPSELTGAEVKALIVPIDLSSEVANLLPLASIETIADQRILGNNDGSASEPEALTAAEVRTILGLDATGTGAVNSVTANNASLTISPTTGAVLANVNLGHTWSWTAGHTFSNVSPTFATMTQGSVFFAGSGGLLSQDNAKFFWDNTNKWLGLGTSSPNASIHIKNTAANKYSAVVTEYTDTTTSTGTDASMGFVLTGPGGQYGNFSGGTDQYNGGVAAGIFKPKQVALHSFSAAENGMNIGTWASDLSVFTANGGTPTIRFAVKATGTTHFAAGSTAAGTAPIKLTSGSLMSSAEAGAWEYLTDKIYFTIATGTARKEITLNDAALTSGRVPYVTTNGRLTDSTNFQWDATNNGVLIGGASASAFHLMAASGTRNDGLQVKCVNLSTGTGGYASCVSVNSAGSETHLVKRSTGFTTAGLLVAGQSEVFATSGNLLMAVAGASDFIVSTNGTATTNERLRADSNGNVTIGNAALATNATNGFLYIPTCAGAPSGTPTTKTGRVAMVFDTTNNKLMIYDGGWIGVTLA